MSAVTRSREPILARRSPTDLERYDRSVALDPNTVAEAARIVQDVRSRGEEAVVDHAVALGDLQPDEPWVLERPELERALESTDAAIRGTLERTARRIEEFARAQLASLSELDCHTEAGEAGHRIVPVERAGCYAPGGRFPLPSSVLMTAVTARTAGVEEVWVASPRPGPAVKAAAAVAGATGLLAVGGAQAIAALAYGAGPIPACDVVVGPGNRWVTAAKQLVSGSVAIDMLAGPSELVVIADGTADPGLVAADLLAQAEHDPDALPILIALDPELVGQVEDELRSQLADLPTAATAEAALKNGFVVDVSGPEETIAACNRIAPEHLQLCVSDPDPLLKALRHFGTIFTGSSAAEVFGDYGAGPNHVLPTDGTARYSGGLSVFDFIRIRTWMHSEPEAIRPDFVRDVVALSRLEGLEAHARAAERRLKIIEDAAQEGR